MSQNYANHQATSAVTILSPVWKLTQKMRLFERLVRIGARSLLACLPVFPELALALRINDTDIGVPPAVSEPGEPLGFRAAQGWHVYWGSTCDEVEIRNVVWLETCESKRRIGFLSRRKLELQERTGKHGANYLPTPYLSGFLGFTVSGRLAQVTLFFDHKDLDVVVAQLRESLGREPTPGRDEGVTSNGKSLVWHIGAVRVSLEPQPAGQRFGRLTLTYLPLAEDLPQHAEPEAVAGDQ